MNQNTGSDQEHFPDFLGIGTTRGGSSWLYRVLSHHPCVWMPPVKELHYFDRPRHGVRTITFFRPRMIGVRLRDYLQGERKRSTGDSLWKTLAWDRKFFFAPRSPEWYQSLFRPRPGQITGEVTPAYAILDERVIAEIVERNPDLKAIYILRNPVDRAWSSVVNTLARKRKRRITDVPLGDLVNQARSVALSDRSDYASVIRRWRSALGEDQLFIGYMEEIGTDPRELIDRICAFLSIPSFPVALEEDLYGRTNTTARHGAPMPAEVREVLVQDLMPCLEDSATLLGGYADQWLEEARRSPGD